MTSQPAHASDIPLVLGSDVRHSEVLAGSAATVQLPRQQADPPQPKLPNPFAAQPVARYACTFVRTALLPIRGQQLLLAVLQRCPAVWRVRSGARRRPRPDQRQPAKPRGSLPLRRRQRQHGRAPTHSDRRSSRAGVPAAPRVLFSSGMEAMQALRGRARRANVVTEDLDKLFAKRKARQKPPTKPG